MTEWTASDEQDAPAPIALPRVLRRGPRAATVRRTRTRRSTPAPQMRRLAEWHLMSPGERHVAWAQLRAWVTWLYDRYELGTEDRLPRCWPQHPGLVEELWALKAWREEIYDAAQPSGQAARYWHAELRQVIHAATTFYAAGCRTGHRGASRLVADDHHLQQRWATASPLTGIPVARLASPHDGQPGHWMTAAAMAEALDTGAAQPLSTAFPDHLRFAGTWWRPRADGWVPITDSKLIARLDAGASRLARADAHAARLLAMRSQPDNSVGHAPAAPQSGHLTSGPPT